MTTTYLTLVNNVLQEINETTLTSGNFTSSRGIQTAVKTFVNKSINDFYNAELEWPWLYVSTTQDTQTGVRLYDLPGGSTPTYRKLDYDSFRLTPKELITNTEFTSNITSWTTVSGTPAYNSAGNGRLRLNSAEATQSISTVSGRPYRVNLRVLDPSSSGSSITLKIGTSSGGTQISSTSLTVSKTGDGLAKTISFDATASTTFISLANTSSDNLDVDYIRVREDTPSTKLMYVSYDRFLEEFAERDLNEDESVYGKPVFVYKTQDNQIGFSPIPDQDTYTVAYEYYKTHSDLSAATDTALHYARFDGVVINRAKYYAMILRSDLQASQFANAEFERGVRRARVEVINRRDSMRDHRVNFGRRVAGGLSY